MAKIVYTANWDWVLFNFRRTLAMHMREQGHDVVLVCPRGDYVEKLTDADGFRWVEWSLQRRSLDPLGELGSVRELAGIYRSEAPELIHQDTIKPNLYGALATAMNRVRADGQPPPVLNAFMGIGFLFSDRPKARLLRPLMLPVMRRAFTQPHVYTTFSNRSDRERFLELGLAEPGASRLMISEFVDPDRFRPSSERTGRDGSDREEVVVLMAARLLWDKGVGEFVEAARHLHSRELPVQMWLAGEPDTESPGFVPESRLREWDGAGIIRWLGHCADMPQLLRRADVGVLPTHYNEGLPRFLVEAAATGLPLVASDSAACRRVVRDRENGFIIPMNDPAALADAVEELAADRDRRRTMGEASRKMALDEFAEARVIREWIDLYDRLLDGRNEAEL